MVLAFSFLSQSVKTHINGIFVYSKYTCNLPAAVSFQLQQDDLEGDFVRWVKRMEKPGVLDAVQQIVCGFRGQLHISGGDPLYIGGPFLLKMDLS